MATLGLHIVPTMSVDDIVTLTAEAEAMGYTHCLLADEGFMPDVYATLALVARATTTMRLGPVTNGYTRHPAATATALATLDEISGGRTFVTMLAGGSMVLPPMGIERRAPLGVVRESIEIMRLLWSGDTVDYEGRHFRLNGARCTLGRHDIPVWIAARGPKLLALTGRVADGTLLTVKPDLPHALGLITEARPADAPPLTRSYIGRICYTPEMVAEQARTFPYILMDSPQRVIDAFGFTPDQLATVEAAIAADDPEPIAEMATQEMLQLYQIAGTPRECRVEFDRVVADNDLDVVMIDVLEPDLSANLAVLRATLEITADAR